MIDNIINTIKSNIGAIVFLLLLFLLIRTVILNIILMVKRSIATRSPTEKNAWSVYKTLCKFGVVIENHPKTWGKYRNMFYKINQSSSVPSELKQNLKKRLVKKGLYIDNMKIIDNYKGDNKI